jgi:hypothetical protein
MLTGDDDAINRYQDFAKYFGLTSDQMLFGQDTSVFTNLGTKFEKYGGKDTSKTTTATTNYGRDNSAKIDYFLKNKPLNEKDLIVDTAHEFPHVLSRHLAAMDSTGGMLKKTVDKNSPDFGITGYGRGEAKKYLNDFDSFSKPNDRFNFFKDRVMSNQAFQMRPELKDKVSNAVANMLTDPVQKKRTDIMSDYKGKVDYSARPEEIWSRAMGAYGEIEKLVSEGNHIVEGKSTNKDYNGVGEMIFIKDKKGKTVKFFRINKNTYDSIKEMINEFKRHKYTISKLGKNQQTTA